MPQVIKRPLEAPPWSDDAKKLFTSSWRNAWAGDGPEAGGTPVLEDGMELAKADSFTPVDLQFIEGRQASLVELCTFFHVAPELMGARAGTYSNLQAFRVGLYQETLGPIMVPIEQAITLQAARPMMGGDVEVYCEFNVEAMMRGTFEEQAQVLQSAVGAPYLTRNEARTLFNRPPLPDGDEIVTPLNVLIGGLASPSDTAPPTFSQAAKGEKGEGHGHQAGEGRHHQAGRRDPAVVPGHPGPGDAAAGGAGPTAGAGEGDPGAEP